MVIIVYLLGWLLLLQIYRYLSLIFRYRRALRSLHKKSQELKYLVFINQLAVTDEQPIDQCLTRGLNTLRDMVGWTYHSIFRLDENRQVLIIRFTGYLPDWYMEKLSTSFLVKVGDLAVGRAVATKQPATINVAYEDPRFRSGRPWASSTGYRSLAGYPMIGKLKTYGSFCTYSIYENIFTVHDTLFFMTCANNFTSILENKLLLSFIKQRHNTDASG